MTLFQFKLLTFFSSTKTPTISPVQETTPMKLLNSGLLCAQNCCRLLEQTYVFVVGSNAWMFPLSSVYSLCTVYPTLLYVHCRRFQVYCLCTIYVNCSTHVSVDQLKGSRRVDRCAVSCDKDILLTGQTTRPTDLKLCRPIFGCPNHPLRNGSETF